jgi:tRNA dimethylallyltransferase
MRPCAILIAGPTASGKSALALDLACEISGAVINADSMQVYRDLRILTARPTVQEEQRAPHRLFGHVDGAVNYSVGCWLTDVAGVVAGLDARGVTPIFVGGTGMYFKAALGGISDIPPVPDAVREAVRAAAQGRPPQDLHAELARHDPQTAATLRPTDPQRILRALEVFAATGRPLVSFHGARSAPLLDAARCACFFLAPERGELFTRIDARFGAMIANGAMEELRTLHARRLDPALPVMRAHGAPHLMAHLDGHMTLEEAIGRGKADTRHYAKRQVTFARHQLPQFHVVAPRDAASAVLATLTSFAPADA